MRVFRGILHEGGFAGLAAEAISLAVVVNLGGRFFHPKLNARQVVVVAADGAGSRLAIRCGGTLRGSGAPAKHRKRRNQQQPNFHETLHCNTRF